MFKLELELILPVVICAFLVGFSKTGFGGMGIIIVPIMASIFPAKISTGILLPFLIFADIIAVVVYRKNVKWRYLFQLFPFAATGVIIGYFLMNKIDNSLFKIFLGILIITLILLSFFIKSSFLNSVKHKNILLAVFLGVLAGITTMMANAAGPIMALYFLFMNMKKIEFVSTRAWYFLVMNCFKVPFSVSLGYITPQSLLFNAYFLPVILIGAIVGYFVLKYIPQKIFNYLIIVIATISAVKILFF